MAPNQLKLVYQLIKTPAKELNAHRTAMDLTNSTKLVSTDMRESSNPPCNQDITESKESILNGKLAFFLRNF